MSSKSSRSAASGPARTRQMRKLTTKEAPTLASARSTPPTRKISTAPTPKQVKTQSASELDIVITAPSSEGTSVTLSARVTDRANVAATSATRTAEHSPTSEIQELGSGAPSPTQSEVQRLLGTEDSVGSGKTTEREGIGRFGKEEVEVREKGPGSEPLLRKAMAQAAAATRSLTQGLETLEKHTTSAPIGLAKTDDEWSDLESVSVCSRRSSVLPSSGKRPGVSMDLATQRANELMLSGKEALEKAGNMKRESKVEALGCLQELYELVLSISDSRSRHRVNLEQERTRAAKEIVRIERAHARIVAELQGSHSNKLSEMQETLNETHKRTEAMWSWLNFELYGPIKSMEGIQEQLNALQATLTSKRQSEVIGKASEPSRELGEVLERIGTMRIEMSNIQGSLNSLIRQAEQGPLPPAPMPQIDSEAAPIPKCCHDASTAQLEPLIKELQTLHKELSALRNDSPPPLNRSEIRDDVNDALKPLTSHLKSFGTILEEIRETKEVEMLAATHDHPAGIGTELALMEIKDKVIAIESALDRGSEPKEKEVLTSEMDSFRITTQAPSTPGIANHKPSYKEALMRPRFPLMVESTNPQHTSHDVVQDIKTKIDVIDLGIGVNGMRKVRNQKVVINCDTEEDRSRLTGAIKTTASGLTATKPLVRRPLLRLVGVAHDLSNAKIEEAVIKQNKKLLPDPMEDKPIVKVLRRTKGRNDSRSNVVLEVCSWVWNSLRDRELRIGYQLVHAVDHSPVMQCYRCLSFGHIARDCEKKHVCGYCAGNHDTRECSNRSAAPKCTNCVMGKQTNSCHPAYSSECPEWKRWDRVARSAVSYY